LGSTVRLYHFIQHLPDPHPLMICGRQMIDPLFLPKGKSRKRF
jgi:hypothetical protein